MPSNPVKGVFGTKANGFDRPIQRPIDEAERQRWQMANQAWWTTSPMRYDWNQEIPFDAGSDEYLAEIDARFLRSVWEVKPWRTLPFDDLIPYDSLSKLDVLEIGPGFGTHASLIAPRARSYTGVDLTETAASFTRTRLEKMKCSNARAIQMDAEELTFPDNCFDFVWSWGVIHHTADPKRILQQMQRVLRPGGQAVVMVYHRSFWKFYVVDGLFNGLGRGLLFRLGSVARVNQAQADGAIARFYRKDEWEDLCNGLFHIDSFSVSGLKSDVVPLPRGTLKNSVLRILPNSWARFFTNRLGWGYFLIAKMTRE